MKAVVLIVIAAVIAVTAGLAISANGPSRAQQLAACLEQFQLGSVDYFTCEQLAD